MSICFRVPTHLTLTNEMMKSQLYKKLVLLTMMVTFVAACKEDAEQPELTVSIDKLSIPPEGSTTEITITCNDSWTINNSGSAWLQISKSGGNEGTTTVQVSATENTSGSTRSTTLVVNSHNGQSRRIMVSQANVIVIPALYPNYNTSPKDPDATGMSSTAVQLAAKMTLGWNIGNTLEATGGETAWGNPKITEEYVKLVKAKGFNAIRIPCAWNGHLDNKATAHINQEWMNRVKEVVGYCVANDMYVLLNIHWDGGWLEHNVTVAKQDSVLAKQKALWEQIATTMRDFDEHVMFASANEPAADNAEKVAVLVRYHQAFIDAVRSTGGKNSYRVLVIQGPNTNMTMTAELMTTLPTDPAANRLMVEVHNYLPAQFCFLNEDVSWGKMAYYWGKDHQSTIEPDRNFAADWGNEDAQVKDFDRMKTAFVDKGVPVLIGEYGAYRRNTPKDLATHNNAVDFWITFVTKQAKSRGMIPFWWDTGGALDRANLTIKDQRTIDALIAGTE
jgi:endoglucanase